MAYGKKWRPALFFGYLKNLGATKEVPGALGTGTTLDQLFTGTAELTYNIPHSEIRGGSIHSVMPGMADEFDAKAKAINSHSILNHRIVLVALFSVLKKEREFLYKTS